MESRRILTASSRGGRSTLVLLGLSALFVAVAATTDGACPQGCSERGICKEGVCQCDAGYGGEDCSIDLNQAHTTKGSLLNFDSLAHGSGERSLQGASLLGGSLEASVQPERNDPSADAISRGFLDPLGMVGGADSEAVPHSLRNMLAYAQHLSSGAAEGGFTTVGGSRTMLQFEEAGVAEGASLAKDALGCGFYDVFYEGCGTTSMCFYDAIPCSAEDPFYDFYEPSGLPGKFLAHPPIVEYDESFEGGLGERDEKAQVVWSAGMPHEYSDGSHYLGGFEPTDSVTMLVPEMPASAASVTMDFNFVGAALPIVTVLGEATLMPTSILPSSDDSVMHLSYHFDYGIEDLKVKFSSPGSNESWGIDQLKIVSLVDNYAPVAEDQAVFMTSNPSGGINTVELRGHDDECGELEYHANMPESETAGAFDSFTYTVKDPKGATSEPAMVNLYVTPNSEIACANPPCEFPVAGKPGLALSFDGSSSILHLGESQALAVPGPAMTLEVRFKVLGDAVGTLIAKEGSYTLGWTSAGGLACTVHGVHGPAIADTLAGYDDSMWHHVLCVYDQGELLVIVDGVMAAGPVPSTGPIKAIPEARVTAGADAMLTKGSHFNGYMDELRIWGKAATVADAVALKATTSELTGAEPELLCYLPFNDMAEGFGTGTYAWDKSSTMSNAVFGMGDGVAKYFPTYVASTDVFGDFAATLEDTVVPVVLFGGDTGGGVTYFISTLPLKGTVYQAGPDGKMGEPITSSPFPVTPGMDKILYLPDKDGYGSPYDIFKYQAYDGEHFSYKQGVVISVHPVNDPPMANSQTITTAVGKEVGVHLTGVDVDFDTMVYTITRLPKKGHLYFADVNMVKFGSPVHKALVVVPGAKNLIYVPLEVGHNPAVDEVYDTFGFTVHDGLTNSSEGVISISIPDDTCVPKPIAGDSGYALAFDGRADTLDLGEASAYLEPGSPFTMELWFRSSEFTSETGMTLIKMGPFKLMWSKVLGLQLCTMGGMKRGPAAASYAMYNDGYWHYVAGSYDGAMLHLIVDSVHFHPVEAGPLPVAADVLSIGYDTESNVEAYYNGLVDELSIWGYARTTPDMIRDARLYGFDHEGLTGRGMKVIHGYGMRQDVTHYRAIHGYDLKQDVFAPVGLVAYWRFNDVPAQHVTEHVSKTSMMLGEGGMAQPDWIVSTIIMSNSFDTVEETDVHLDLTCVSQYATTLDAVVVALPLNGHLFYTADGSTKLFEIKTVPTILKDRKVIYNSGMMGPERKEYFTGGEGEEWGDFRYVCIGDLQDTVDQMSAVMLYNQPEATRHLLSVEEEAEEMAGEPEQRLFAPRAPQLPLNRRMLEVPEYAPSPKVALVADHEVLSTSRRLLQMIEEDLPMPPPPVLTPLEDPDSVVIMPLTPHPPPNTDALIEMGLMSSFYGEQPMGVPPELVMLAPAPQMMPPPMAPVPPPMAPPYVYPTHRQAMISQSVVEQLLEDLFPTGNALGKPLIAAVDFTAVYLDLSIDDLSTMAQEMLFREDHIKTVAAAAKVPMSAVSISNIVETNGVVKVMTTVLYPPGSMAVQEDATAFASALESSPGSVFTMTKYGRVGTEELSLRSVQSTVTEGSGLLMSDCYQVSAVQTVVVGAEHVNHMPIACNASNYMCMPGVSIPYGSLAEVEITLPAFDPDGDDMTVMLTYLPMQGQLKVDGELVTEANSELRMDEFGMYSLTYVPLMNGMGMGFDKFGYTVSDNTTTTMEHVISIDVDDSQMENPMSAAGNSGYALEFDGDRDEVRLGGVSEYEISDQITLGCWMKTSALTSESRMTLVKAGPYQLKWTKVKGFQFNVGMVTVPTYQMFNDGLWHYVEASYDGHVAMLMVDSMMLGERMAETPPMGEVMGPIMLGTDGTGDMETFYNGELDELVMYNMGALNVSMEMHDPKGKRRENLVGYFRFNAALLSEVLNEIEGYPSGMRGSELGEISQPSWVPSTIIMSNKIHTLEDKSVMFTLEGVSNYETEPKVKVTSLTLPLAGWRHAALSKGSKAPAESAFVYTPYFNYFGEDEFTYTITDCCSPTSSPVKVYITVDSVNETPEIGELLPVMADFRTTVPVTVPLSATDGSYFFTGTFYITYLPKYGTLYQTLENGVLRDPIMEANTAVTSCDPGSENSTCMYSDSPGPYYGQHMKPMTYSSVVYSPMLNMEAMHDSFGFVAVDEEEMSSTEAVVRVEAVVDGLPNVVNTPVMSEAGLALEFDGTPAHSLATLGTAGSLGIDGTLSVSMFFKTSSLTVETQMTLFSVGMYSIFWTKVKGLQFVAGSANVATYSALNDGAWHFVHASFDGERAVIAVDGKVEPGKTVMAPVMTPAASPVLLGSSMVGYEADGESAMQYYFNGQVDEVMIGGLGMVAGVFHFNEPVGNHLRNDINGDNMAGSLGRGGMTGPERLTSTLHLETAAFTMLEDTDLVIPLVAISTDPSAPDLEFTILSLPTRGSLYNMHEDGLTGRKIKSVPRTVSSNEVLFRPAKHDHDMMGMYAEFTYSATTKPLMSVGSTPKTVTIFVRSVNDHPTLQHNALEMRMHENLEARFDCTRIAPVDVETSNLTYVITTLPTIGLLYQADGKTPIMKPGSPVGMRNEVVYVPPANVKGLPLTSFSLLATDFELSTEEATVTIFVQGNDALNFADSAPVVVENAQSLQLMESFTVDAWTDAGFDPSLFSSRVIWPSYMSISGEVEFASDRWHHIAAVYSRSESLAKTDDANYYSGRYLYVDGELVGVKASGPNPAIMSDASVLTIGGTEEGERPFPGALDEVRIWSKGLEQYEVLMSKATPAVGPGHELFPDLMAYWSFDNVLDGTEVADGMGKYHGVVKGATVQKVHVPTVAQSAEVVMEMPVMTSTTGTAGYALTFDGEDDMAECHLPTAEGHLNTDFLRSFGGMNIDLWFKSSSTNAEGALISVGNVSVHWTRAGGLGLHVGPSMLNTFHVYNDGYWHHVMADVQYVPSGCNVPDQDNARAADVDVPGTYSLNLTVDMEKWSMDGGHFVELLVPNVLHMGVSAHQGWQQFGSPYSGTIDEVLVTMENMQTTLAYYTFDEAYGTSVKDMTGGKSCMLEGAPMWVFSSAPLDKVKKLFVPEEGSLVIQLSGSDGDGDMLRAHVLTLPQHGTLYNMDGTPLVELPVVAGSLPAEVIDDNGYVVFVGAVDANGETMFTYAVGDGYTMSDPAVVGVEVTPVNDAPVIVQRVHKMVTLQDRPVSAILLGHMDVDDDAVTYRITTLPKLGVLSIKGESVSEQGFVFDPTEEVVYTPPPNSLGADGFGYEITDGMYTSAEATVEVVINLESTNHRPVAGRAGNAIAMRESRIDVPLGMEFGEYTMEIWMRLSDAAGSFQTLFAASTMNLMIPFKAGMHYSTMETAIHTTTPLSNSVWHHIGVSYSMHTQTVQIAIDIDHEVVEGHVEFPYPAFFDVLSIGGDPNGAAFSLTGVLDDFRMWNTFRGPYYQGITAYSLLHGNEFGLVFFLPFDGESGQGGDYHNELMSNGTINAHAHLAAGTHPPEAVTSTAPLTDYPRAGTEDNAMELALTGTDTDHDALTYFITSLPRRGTLMGNQGEPIRMLPYMLEGAAVEYMPNLHECGLMFDTFGYAVFDGEEYSQEAFPGVHYFPVPDGPELIPVEMQPLRVTSTGHVTVMLSASDADLLASCPTESSVDLRISTLPEIGTLWQTMDGVIPLEPITTSDVSVKYTRVNNRTGIISGMVIYIPVDDVSTGYYPGAQERPEYTVFFGYYATDISLWRYWVPAYGPTPLEELHLPPTEELIVDILVKQVRASEEPLDLTRPAPRAAYTLAGQALYLDGKVDVQKQVLSLQANSSFSFEVWFKSSGPIHEHATLVNYIGVFNISWRGFTGLQLEVFTQSEEVVTATAGAALNDGFWHHVVGSYINPEGRAMLRVDDDVFYSSNVTLSSNTYLEGLGDYLVLGGDGTGRPEYHFHGLVDEFRMWDYALPEEAIMARRNRALDGNEPGLLLYYQFDQKDALLGPYIKDSSMFNFTGNFIGEAEPMFVASTAPVFLLVKHTMEDMPLRIDLVGTDVDSQTLEFHVTSLPTQGYLAAGRIMTRIVENMVEFYIEGDIIEMVPYKLPAADVVYMPARHQDSMASFGFAVFDGVVHSTEGEVQVMVHSMNDSPVALPVPPVVARPESMVPVTLRATDADRASDTLSFVITTLPEVGDLYTTMDGVEPMEPIMTPHFNLSTMDQSQRAVTVLYSTHGIDTISQMGMLRNMSALFGFVVVDGNNEGPKPEGLNTTWSPMYQETSVEQLVSITIELPNEQHYSSYSGMKGYAVMFDGSDDFIEIPAVESAAPLTEFTIMMWVKSTGAILDGATLFGTPSVELSWTSFGGLGMHTKDSTGSVESHHSQMQLNDGNWHHVAVRGEQDGSLHMAVDHTYYPVGRISGYSGLDLSGGYTLGRSKMFDGGDSFYKGMMTHVTVLDKTLSVEELAEISFVGLDRTDFGPNFMSHLIFSSADVVVKAAKVHDHVTGLHGSVHGQPTVITSTAPILKPIYTQENAPVVIDLLGPEFANTSIEVMITLAPAKGMIYEILNGVPGPPIQQLPYLLQGDSHLITFVSDPFEHGDAMASPSYLYSSFKFLTHQTDINTFSDEQTVVVVVYEMNFAPLLPVPTSSVSIGSYDMHPVVLFGEDPDGDSITISITTLPTLGTLYTMSGTVIDVAGFALPVDETTVIFSPVVMDAAPLLNMDSSVFFGYTVVDTAGLAPVLSVKEATVTLVVEETAHMPPISGDPCYALLFDGGDPVLVEEKGPVVTPFGVTVEAWVKTSGGMTLSSMSIVKTAQFELYMSRISGLTFALFSDTGATLLATPDGLSPDEYATSVEPLNDGYWHFVAATYDPTILTMKLFIDGQEKSSFTTSVGPLVDVSEGGNFMAMGTQFSGLIEDVRVWGTALKVGTFVPDSRYQWNATGAYGLSGEERDLLAYFRFNEAAGAVTSSPVGDMVATVPETVYWVPSAAPFGNMARTGEDRVVTIALQGSVQVDGGGVYITEVPRSGTLYQMDGTPIPFANTFVTDAQGRLRYMPELDFNGMDDFIYVAAVVAGDPPHVVEWSAETHVEVEVLAVNDPPTVCYYTPDLYTYLESDVEIQLRGKDVDGEVEIHILALPVRGTLWQYGNPIEGVPSPVVDRVDGAITYKPLANGEGFPYDYFVFAAWDGFAYSVEVTVYIDAYIDQILYVQDKDTTIGSLKEAVQTATSDMHSGEITIELFVKSAELSRRLNSRRSLQQSSSGAYVDVVSSGGDMNVPDLSTTAQLMLELDMPLSDVTDGDWHHVAMALEGVAGDEFAVKKLYVDGNLDMSQAVMYNTLADDYVMSFNSMTNESLTNTLNLFLEDTVTGDNVYIDELAIWSSARSLAQVRMDMMAPKAKTYWKEFFGPRQFVGELPHDLVLYRSFDQFAERVENVADAPRVSAGVPVAGEAGYSYYATPRTSLIAEGSGAFNLTEQGFTMQLWFRVSAGSTDLGTLVSKGIMLGPDTGFSTVDPDAQYAIQWTPHGGLTFFVGVSPAECGYLQANSFGTYNDGSWHKVTATFDGAQAHIYVDTNEPSSSLSLAAKGSAAGAECTLMANFDVQNYRVQIGSNTQYMEYLEWIQSAAFEGFIDELRVYDMALTPIEISDRAANTTGTVSIDNLMGYYKFNEATGSDVYPRVGNMTISGSIDWLPSTIPLNTTLQFQGFQQDAVLIEMFGSDPDGDDIVFIVSKVPVGGQLYQSDEEGNMGIPINHNFQIVNSNFLLYRTGSAGVLAPEMHDTWSYTVSDGKSYAKPLDYNVFVYGANKLPIAQDLRVEVLEDAQDRPIELRGSDPEGQALVARVTVEPLFGTVHTTKIIDPNLAGQLIVLYTPNADYVGEDVFSYTLIDTQGGESEPATVEITVIPINDAPTLEVPESMTMYGDKATLPSTITVRDVDLGKGIMDVVVTANIGLLSTVSQEDARTGTPSVAFSGNLLQVNNMLGNIYYYNPDRETSEITFLVDDNGYTGAGGAKSATGVMEVRVSDIPVDAVEFTADGLGIIIVYNQATDRASMTAANTDCTTLLKDESIPQLGLEAYCKFIDDTTFRIYLGSGATIVPGDYLHTKGLPEEVISFTATGEWMEPFELEVGAPASALLPVAYISGASSVGLCDPVLVNGYYSTGDAGRELYYNWRVFQNGVDISEDILTPEFLGISSQGLINLPVMEIPPYTLTPDATYEIKLAVTNFLRKTSEVVAKDVFYSSQALPNLVIDGLTEFSIMKHFDLSVRAVAEPSSCRPDDQSALVYEWTQLPGTLGVDLGVTDTSLLYMPGGSLSPTFQQDGAYQFRVTVYNASEPELAVSETVTVTVVQQHLVALIAGQDRSHPRAYALALDSSTSYDPDADAAGLAYSWSCVMEDGGSGCTDISGNPLSSSDATYTMAADTLAAGIYLFQMTMTTNNPADERTASAYARIEVSAEDIPMAYIDNYDQIKFNFRDKLTLYGSDARGTGQAVTYEWSHTVGSLSDRNPCPLKGPECTFPGVPLEDLNDPSVANTRATSRFLQLKSDVLLPGTYFFTVTVRDAANPSLEGYATVPVVVDASPEGGVMQVLPTEGVEMETTLMLKASGYQDADVPMQYELGFISEAAGFLSMTSVGVNYVFQTELPSSLSYASLKVFDSYLVYREAKAVATISQLADADVTARMDLIEAEIMPMGDADLALAQLEVVQGVLNAAPVADDADDATKTAREQLRERAIQLVLDTRSFRNSDALKTATVLVQGTSLPLELSRSSQTTLADELDTMTNLNTRTSLSEELGQAYTSVSGNLVEAALAPDLTPAVGGVAQEPYVSQEQMSKLDGILSNIMLLILMEDGNIPGVTLTAAASTVLLSGVMNETAVYQEMETGISGYTLPQGVAIGSRKRRSLLQDQEWGTVQYMVTKDWAPQEEGAPYVNPKQSYSPCPVGSDENDLEACDRPLSLVSTIQTFAQDGIEQDVSINDGDEPITLILPLHLDFVTGQAPRCKRWDQDSTEWTAEKSNGVETGDVVNGADGTTSVECKVHEIAGDYAVFPENVASPPAPSPPPPTPADGPPRPISPPPFTGGDIPPPADDDGGSGDSTPVAAIVGGVVGGFLVVLGAGVGAYIYKKRRRRTPVQSMESRPLVGDDGMQPRKGQPSGAVRTAAMLETEN
ncbi:hypothetical protein CYMTET_14706 [Cymbomonas tetramitiformis]|uniref:EGF-like domain-containing protein n=1 Tax=Cymbomonas tetramitiformis TaxID=36881 RepID=A0AAE0GH15_9CHLO|nr:hypothetical protein CYMTET_14706 [Cymbomonas tetramitiformis]